MLWQTIAWTTGLASGAGSSLAVQSLPWRYAPPMGAWMLGLWMNNTYSGMLRLFGQGAVWGGAGGVLGLVGYDLYNQYRYWWLQEEPPTLIPDQTELVAASITEKQQPEGPQQPEPSQEDKDSKTTSGPPKTHFMNPPRVSQGNYSSRKNWWRANNG